MHGTQSSKSAETGSVEPKLHVICAINDNAAFDRLRAVFHETTKAGLVCLHPSIGAAENLAADTPFLISVNSPVKSVANDLLRGVRPDKALAGWREEARTLLASCEGYGPGSCVVSFDSLIGRDEHIRKEISQRFEIRLGHGALPRPDGDIDHRAIVFASALLRSEEGDAGLAGEVESRMLGSFIGLSLEPGMLASAWKAHNQAEIGLRLKEEECGILQDILDSMISASDKHTRLFAETLQQATSGRALPGQSGGNDLKVYKHQIKLLKETLDAVQNSTSWKLTRPLRFIVSWLRKR